MLYDFIYSIVTELLNLFLRIKYRVRVHGTLPDDFGKCGYVVVSNHQNYLDPVVIAVLTAKKRVRLSFMAKSELFEKNPFFAALIRFCGAFPVNRGAGDNTAVERAVSDIKKGKVFVIFAEGHRSETGEIAACKTGFAFIAEKAGCKVLPVCIVYGLGGNKKKIDFMTGDAIEPEKNPEREYKKRLAAQVTDRLRELQKYIYEKENHAADKPFTSDGNNSGE